VNVGWRTIDPQLYDDLAGPVLGSTEKALSEISAVCQLRAGIHLQYAPAVLE
jgi:hypothetical protein